MKKLLKNVVCEIRKQYKQEKSKKDTADEKKIKSKNLKRKCAVLRWVKLAMVWYYVGKGKKLFSRVRKKLGPCLKGLANVFKQRKGNDFHSISICTYHSSFCRVAAKEMEAKRT